MGKVGVLWVGLLALSGCALMPDKTVALAEATDPTCSAAAAARARDAAINGYDTAVQTTIRDNSYKSCVAWAQKATIVEYGRR